MSKVDAHAIRADFLRVKEELGRTPSNREYEQFGKFSPAQVKAAFGSFMTLFRAAGQMRAGDSVGTPEEKREPKVLVFDIETAPILGYVWGLWENNVGLNQIKSDWHLLSWAAKWLGKPEVMYMDQRGAKNIEDDKKILEGLWKLLDEADCVITQNGKSFDSKKVNARFILNGMGPPSPYEHIDTKILAKKHFAFTSNKLEYMSEKLCTKKKLKHKAFQGFDLWRECIAGNPKAWDEMARYNKNDVLATEELYLKLAPWGGAVDLNAFSSSLDYRCVCGKIEWKKEGFKRNRLGKFQRYKCGNCGAWHQESGAANNQMPIRKRQSFKGPL